jgi:hypothetical protein
LWWIDAVNKKKTRLSMTALNKKLGGGKYSKVTLDGLRICECG